MIKATFIATLLFFVATNLHGAVYSTIADGRWTDDSNWSAPPTDNECKVAGNDVFNIAHNISMDCAALYFIGNVTINILNGAVLSFDGSGNAGGSTSITIGVGAQMIVNGDLSLGGASSISVSGNLTVYGNLIGAGNVFDCNGFFNGGTVLVGGVGCANCTNSSDAGCAENVALPVNLLDFSTTNISNDAVLLSWITTFEKNNKRFDLERSSDGFNFTLINSQTGKVFSEAQTTYNFVDDHLSAGTYYYRLFQEDMDGSRTRSATITATIGANHTTIEVTPNPAIGNNFRVDLSQIQGSEIRVDLLDMHGATIMSFQQVDESSTFSISVAEFINRLEPGIYLINASNQAGTISKMVVVN